jgi:hypothetical protein
MAAGLPIGCRPGHLHPNIIGEMAYQCYSSRSNNSSARPFPVCVRAGAGNSNKALVLTLDPIHGRSRGDSLTLHSLLCLTCQLMAQMDFTEECVECLLPPVIFESLRRSVLGS